MSFWSRIRNRGRHAAYVRGITRFNRGDYRGAVSAFEDMLRDVRGGSNPDIALARFYAAEAHAKIGMEYISRGKLERAERELRRALSVERSYPALHYFLAVVADRQGRSAWALDHLQQALDLNPRDPHTLALRARIALEQGEIRTARMDLEALAEEGVRFVAPETFRDELIDELRDFLERPAVQENDGGDGEEPEPLGHRLG